MLRLSAMRKKRVVSQSLVPAEHLAKYSVVYSIPLHSTSKPGILCVDIALGGNTNMIVTGGADGTVIIFDPNERKVVYTLTGHTKAVKSVSFTPITYDRILSSSLDGTARAYNARNGELLGILNADHEIVSSVIHVSGDYAILCGTSSWSFWGKSL